MWEPLTSKSKLAIKWPGIMDLKILQDGKDKILGCELDQHFVGIWGLEYPPEVILIT